MLESGYRPKAYFSCNTDKCEENDNFDDLTLGVDRNGGYKNTIYSVLDPIPNHEPMLDLLLEHNISGQPSKNILKKEYDECYKDYQRLVRSYVYFLYNQLKGIDEEKEREAILKYRDEKKYKKYSGDITSLTNLLIRDGIIVRIPQEPDKKKIKYFKDKMNYYKKYCVEDKELVVESLFDIDSPSSPFEKLLEFEDIKPDENATFKGTREFINYMNDEEKNNEISWILGGYETCDGKDNAKKFYCEGYERRVFFKNGN